MNNSMEFLLWVKGPAFDIALFIFIAGIIIRVLEILLLGRKKDFSAARSSEVKGGMRTLVTRFVPEAGIMKRSPLVIIAGYLWHAAWFVIVLFFVPHIEVFKNLIGFSWPGLSNQLIDIATIIAMLSLLALLIYRIIHPVLKFISSKEDYLVWLLTFVPLVTGYMVFHHLLVDYQLMLGLHILSVELFLIIFPFTKLMHAVTVFMARWYSGVLLGRKEPGRNEPVYKGEQKL